MKELTFIAGSKLFKFQIRNDKSIWAWDYRLKAWIPQDKIKDIKGNKIDITKEKNWLKKHNQEEITKDIKEEMAKAGAKLIKKEEK